MHPTTLDYQEVPILRDFVHDFKDYVNPKKKWGLYS